VSLVQQIEQDMKSAMRQKDKQVLSTLRLLRATIKKEEIDKRTTFNDEQILDVIVRAIKQRKDSVAEYSKAGREDLAEKEQNEIEILTRYLPKQLSESELRALIQETIEAVGAKTKKDLGKVMGAVLPKVKGKADGKTVNQLVREYLE
jgi:uncharacterized protein YqeY